MIILLIPLSWAWSIQPNPSRLPQSCQTYECFNQTNSQSPYCEYSGQNSIEIYQCDPGQYCNVGGYQGKCSNQTVYLQNQPAGGYCTSSSDCRPGASGSSCVNNRCALNGSGGCLLNVDCGIGQYCSDSVCVNQKKIGEACYANEDCVNNAGCLYVNSTTNVCTQYFSLDPGEKIQNCSTWSYQTYMCKSGICYADGNGQNGACIGDVSVLQDLQCKTDSECETTKDSTINQVMYTSCDCGFNGQSYCGLAPGNVQWQNWLDNYKTFVQTQEFLQCNTAERVGLGCFIMADVDLYMNLTYYYFQAFNYAQYAMNWTDTCILQSTNKLYYEAYKNKTTPPTPPSPPPPPTPSKPDEDSAIKIVFGLLASLLL